MKHSIVSSSCQTKERRRGEENRGEQSWAWKLQAAEQNQLWEPRQKHEGRTLGTCVHVHNGKKELGISSFLDVCHSGCGHPPGDDGMGDAFKTSSQLWSLPSRVEPGGVECAGTSLCLKKAKAWRGWWGIGQLATARKCGKSLASVKLPSNLSSSALHYPSPLHLPVWSKDSAWPLSSCTQRNLTSPNPHHFEEARAKQLTLTESLLYVGMSHTFSHWSYPLP